MLFIVEGFLILLLIWLWSRPSGQVAVVIDQTGVGIGHDLVALNRGLDRIVHDSEEDGLGRVADAERDDELVAEVGETMLVVDEEPDLIVDELETVVPVLGRLLGGHHWLRILLSRAEFDILEATPCNLARRHSVSAGGRYLVSASGNWCQIRAFMGVVTGLLVATEPDYCSVTISVAGQYMGRLIGVGGDPSSAASGWSLGVLT